MAASAGWSRSWNEGPMGNLGLASTANKSLPDIAHNPKP